MSLKSGKCTSVLWCWCDRMAMSPGAAIRCRTIRQRSSIRFAAGNLFAKSFPEPRSLDETNDDFPLCFDSLGGRFVKRGGEGSDEGFFSLYPHQHRQPALVDRQRGSLL